MDKSTIGYILYGCCASIFLLSFCVFHQFKGIGIKGEGLALKLILFSFIVFPIIGFYIIFIGALYFTQGNFFYLAPLLLFHFVYLKYYLIPSLDDDKKKK